jgi:hypothetical protein
MKRTTSINDPATPSIWDDKHPKAPVVYEGRPLPGTAKAFEMDVRRFIYPPGDVVLDRLLGSFDPDLGLARASVKCGDIDAAAWAIQIFVCRILRYVGDDKLGAPEFWLFPAEALGLRRGDCEDGAILTASLCRAVGIPDWRIRVAAGLVNPGRGAEQGGHAWATYLRADQTWIALDWCFYADPQTHMDKKLPIAQRSEYIFGNQIWFSFNDVKAWSHEGEVRIRGRVREGSKP